MHERVVAFGGSAGIRYCRLLQVVCTERITHLGRCALETTWTSRLVHVDLVNVNDTLSEVVLDCEWRDGEYETENISLIDYVTRATTFIYRS